MKNKLLLSLLCITLCSFGNNSTPFNQELFISKLEKLYGKKLPITFFIIQANTQLELYTNAPAIIKRTREIQSNHYCPYVFFIWKDPAGIGNKHIVKFMKDNFYIDTTQFIKPFISEELYDLLGSTPNSEVYYFKERKLLKKWDGKYDRLPTNSLPHSFLSVEKENDIIWNDYSDYYHTNMSLYKPINDSLAVELFDGQEDRIRLTNILTGKVKKVMPLYNTINYIDVYIKIFNNPLNLSKEELERNDAYFKDIKRTPVRIGNAYVKNENEIYILGDVDVYHKAKSDFYIPGEYNTKTINVKKGALTNSNYALIIKTDTSFKVKDTLLMENFDELNDFQKNHFFTWEDAFYINDSLTYFTGYPYDKYIDKNYEDLFKRNKSTKFIYTFRKNGKLLEPKEIGNATCKYPFEMFYRYEDFEIFGTNKSIYATNLLFPEIYKYENTYPVAFVVDTTIVKSYVFVKDYEESSKKENIPFSVLCYAPINNNSMLAVFYFLKTDFYIGLFDSKMHILERRKITDLIDMKKELFNYELFPFFTDNYLNFIHCKNGQVNNRRLKIKFKAYNTNVLPKDEYFIK